MSLGCRWANEVLRCQPRNNLGHFVGVFHDFSCDLASCARKDTFNSGRVANQDDRIARHTGFTPNIELQECGVRRRRSLKLESCQIGMRRNFVEPGRDALRVPGKVRRIRRGKCGSALVEKLFHCLITPPMLSDVVIREETSIACYEKSGAKNVKLERRSRSLCFERHHPLVVHERLTRGIRGDANYLSGDFVPKLHNHVQQADAGSVRVNYRFRDAAFVLKPVQAILRLMKLLLEGFAIRVPVRGHLFANLFGLRFKSVAWYSCRRSELPQRSPPDALFAAHPSTLLRAAALAVSRETAF